MINDESEFEGYCANVDRENQRCWDFSNQEKENDSQQHSGILLQTLDLKMLCFNEWTSIEGLFDFYGQL